MSHPVRSALHDLRALGGAALLALVAASSALHAQAVDAHSAAAPRAFTVDGALALHSFMSLGDLHMRKLADVLTLIAVGADARSARWQRIRPSLVEAARVDVPAALWFALPNGSYWTLAQGRADAKLADRQYFRHVLAGETVVGDLVVSRSTGRNTAIVAVPVRDAKGAVVGVLGASVHLDSLSALLREEMGGLPDDALFFAIDATPLGAVHSDPTLIFTEPMKLGDEAMRKAFVQMLAHHEGVVTYEFRGRRRTVLYHRSTVTGWWYAFGMTERAQTASATTPE